MELAPMPSLIRVHALGPGLRIAANLIAHRNEVVSREQLPCAVWGYDQVSVTRTVDNYIAKLRT